MKRVLLVISALLIAPAAQAGKRLDSCEAAELVPDKGWVYTPVPCASLERPMPCTREWTDEKGDWHSVVIACPAGTKQKTYEQVEREEEAAKEKACGKDYGELRVGMTIKRFEQCNEALAFETETVSQAGVVELYRATFFWIQARHGKIISYTRRMF